MRGGNTCIPGGIDPHTHMHMPFMGTVTMDDFYTGTVAGLAGGNTTIIDFVMPSPKQRLMEAYPTWRDWARQAASDYGLHMAVTWWDESVRRTWGRWSKEEGVTSFKHFMAYKNAIMADDETLVNCFRRASELGAVPMVHAENGELVYMLQRELVRAWHHGAEGHPLSRPPAVEGEATNRAIAIAERAERPALRRPRLVQRVARRDRLGARQRAARFWRGPGWPPDRRRQRLLEPGFHAGRGSRHEPSVPVRAKTRRRSGEASRAACFRPRLPITAPSGPTQKAKGRNNFAQIPNGCGGVEERLAVVWDAGVNTGRLTPSEFVAATSTNAARIFNLYPRKGCRGRWCRRRPGGLGFRGHEDALREDTSQQGRLQRVRGAHGPRCAELHGRGGGTRTRTARCAPKKERAST